jgi:hypothetical protein
MTNETKHRRYTDVLKDEEKIKKVKKVFNDDNVLFEPVLSGFMVHTRTEKLTVKQIEFLHQLGIQLEDDKLENTILRFKQHKQRFFLSDFFYFVFIVNAIVCVAYSSLTAYYYFSL